MLSVNVQKFRLGSFAKKNKISSSPSHFRYTISKRRVFRFDQFFEKNQMKISIPTRSDAFGDVVHFLDGFVVLHEVFHGQLRLVHHRQVEWGLQKVQVSALQLFWILVPAFFQNFRPAPSTMTSAIRRFLFSSLANLTRVHSLRRFN